MARYFDAYRIDHILGFFRIWEVPRQAQSAILGHFYPSMPYSAEDIKALGLKFDDTLLCSTDLKNSDTLFVAYPEGGFTPRIEGYKTPMFKALSAKEQQAYMQLHEEFFYHRHNDFWRENAMRRLPALMQATRMLTCGEDLGMIPACVPEVMAQERILSLEIERMPKEYGLRFARTQHYPYLSVATPSTHDMSTLREWRQEDRDDTQCFYNNILGFEGKAPIEMDGAVAKAIVAEHLQSPSMLTLIAWQDWMATDEKLRRKEYAEERINIPSNRGHVWNYRMHMTIESLFKARTLNRSILRMISESGRSPNDK
jgi:4-alpha-glucanotransferase